MLQEENICQVAFSALDAAALRGWYRDVFGFLDAGGTVFGGPSTDRVQGMEKVRERCLWLVDSQQYFQLEFFQFWSPQSKPAPADSRPCDIGYRVLGIVVEDFDAVLARALAAGPGEPAIRGEPGKRRASLQDIEGNWVDIYEEDPLPDTLNWRVRPEVPATVRSMTLSVPDLEASSQAWTGGLGLAHDRDGGLGEGRAPMGDNEPVPLRCRVLRSRNFLVELAEYEPGEAKPRPPGYRICDQGFMNIAVGLADTAAFDRRFAIVQRRGFHPNGKPLDIGVFKVMYVNDPFGFSVELLNARRASWFLSGFKPSLAYVVNEIWIDRTPAEIWPALTEHGACGKWCTFDGRLVEAGAEEPNGLGAKRELKGLGMTFVEEVVEWEREHRYRYRLLRGAPLRDHSGEIRLTPDHGGTRLRWSIAFRGRIPLTGKPTAWVLQRLFKRDLCRFKQLIEG